MTLVQRGIAHPRTAATSPQTRRSPTPVWEIRLRWGDAKNAIEPKVDTTSCRDLKSVPISQDVVGGHGSRCFRCLNLIGGWLARCEGACKLDAVQEFAARDEPPIRPSSSTGTWLSRRSPSRWRTSSAGVSADTVATFSRGVLIR